MSADPYERENMPPLPDIPGKFSDMGSLSGSGLSQVTDSNLSQVSSSLLSSEQQKSSLWSSDNSRSLVSEASDSIGPLLPSTVFGQSGSVGSSGRSASAPPQDNAPIHPLYRSGLSSNRRLSNVRKISPPETNATEGAESIASIDATLHSSSDNQVIIVPDQTEANPPMLPELQHLAIPPPPPPPPLRIPDQGGSGVINIAIDEKSPTSAIEKQGSFLPQPMERASTASPTHHRRNMPSGGGDSFGARIRGIGDRMRSNSKNRTKSPPLNYAPSPYESVLPPFMPGHQRHESLPQKQRAQSPYEQAMAAQIRDQFKINSAAPTSPSSDLRLNETSIPPSSLPGSRSGSTVGGYRNPKDIRANMPPVYMQHGASPSSNGFL
jgi:hypothetical protein